MHNTGKFSTMKGIRIEQVNGDYQAISVDLTYDSDGEIDFSKLDNAWLFDDDIDTFYVVVYDGMVYFPLFTSMEEVEDEFEDKVVDALKKDGLFREIEYSDDPDDDDKVCEIRLLTFKMDEVKSPSSKKKCKKSTRE